MARQFAVDERLFQYFPELIIGVVVVSELDNTVPAPEIAHLWRTVQQELREKWGQHKIQEHPHVIPWRTAFQRLQMSGSRFPSSIEAMGRRVLKGQDLPSINPLVDLYNSLSLRYLVPMGGHALEAVVGDIWLTFSQGGEPFRPLGETQVEVVSAGEVVYKDAQKILTRRWVWRQCDEDKVLPSSREVFIPIDLLGERGRERGEEIITAFSSLSQRYLPCRIQSALLDSAHRVMTFEGKDT